MKQIDSEDELLRIVDRVVDDNKSFKEGQRFVISEDSKGYLKQVDNNENDFLEKECKVFFKGGDDQRVSQNDSYHSKEASRCEERNDNNGKVAVPEVLPHNNSLLNDAEELLDNQVQRVPIDVQAMKMVIAKNFVRCCGTYVSLYNEDYGFIEEHTIPQLHVAIRRCLTPEMNMKVGRHKLDDVVHRIMSCPELQISLDDFDKNTSLINFKDCVYNVKTQKKLPHSPDYLFTSYIDAELGYGSSGCRIYRANNNRRSVRYFDQFLEDCTEGDLLKKKSLQQLTGYIISNEWMAKKFFVLIGKPHTGKSVWLAIWKSLVGPKHTTAMSLKQLGETRFMTAELFKSKLNISAEMDESGSIKATDIIKTITGGDLLTAEKKGKDPFQFQGKTKLVAAGNYMPHLDKLDGTSAFTDRLMFLVFNNPIPEERRDKDLLMKLSLEKSYIVEWALEGLEELMHNKLIFTESEDALKFKRRYISELNNVTEFIQDRCKIEPSNYESKVHRRSLFQADAQYCNDNGYSALSKTEFFVEIEKLDVMSVKLRINGSSPLMGYRGLRFLREEELKAKRDSDF